MTSIRELERRRENLLREAADAAAQAKTPKLFELTGALHHVESVLAKFAEAEAEAKGILQPGATVPSDTVPPKRVPRRAARSGGGREIGARVREEFLARARSAGVDLLPHRGAIYRTSSGVRVGTAVASERHADRWFLGLGEDAFDAAALLCVADNGRTYEVCLPAPFFAQHGAHLSRSGGQVKFNVARRGPSLIVKVPRHDPVVVDRYLAAYAGLAKDAST